MISTIFQLVVSWEVQIFKQTAVKMGKMFFELGIPLQGF